MLKVFKTLGYDTLKNQFDFTKDFQITLKSSLFKKYSVLNIKKALYKN